MEAGDQRRHLTPTHVKRVARRLGLTTATTPDTIEQDLVAVATGRLDALFTPADLPWTSLLQGACSAL
jgi:hypothetical protein